MVLHEGGYRKCTVMEYFVMENCVVIVATNKWWRFTISKPKVFNQNSLIMKIWEMISLIISMLENLSNFGILT